MLKINLRNKLIGFFVLLVTITALFTGYFVVAQAERTLLNEKETKIQGLAQRLDVHLEGDYNLILARKNLLQASKEQKSLGLRQEFEPILKIYSEAFPSIGFGYYSTEFEEAIAYLHPKEKGNIKPKDFEVMFSRNHLGRKVLESGEPLTEIGHTTWGETISHLKPIFRNEQIIGYVVVNELIPDITATKTQLVNKVIFISFLGVFLGSLGVYLLVGRVLADIEKLKIGIEALQYDLKSPFPRVSKDLLPVSNAIQELSASLDALQNTSRNLVGSLYLEESLQHAMDMLTKIYGAEHCCIMLRDEHSGDFRIRSSYGLSNEFVQTCKNVEKNSLIALAAQSGQFIQSNQIGKDRTSLWSRVAKIEGLKSLLTIPLMGKGKAIGVVNVFSKNEKSWSAQEISFLSSITNQIALGIENSILFEEMETKAITDRLTSLYNHKYMYEEVAREIDEAEIFGYPVTMLLMDIDYFKNYNDTYGHPAGDKVLRQFAKILKESVRPDDLVARYGGEEFVVVLKNMEAVQALDVAERIRKGVEDYPFEGRENQPGGSVTVSIGIAQYPIHASNKDELIKRSDEALYKAKHTKRNAVVIYHSVLDSLFVGLSEKEKDEIQQLKTIISIINAKDKYTYGHSERVVEYTRAMGQRMGIDPRQLKNIIYAAFLHDIGKIDIPTDLLCKDGDLSEEEWLVIKEHPVNSQKALVNIPVLGDIVPLIFHHHERFDGRGYPSGLVGEEIPLGARIIAIADSFDAMTTQRSFQKSKPLELAMEELQQEAGRQFDPQIVRIFIEILQEANYNQKD